MLYRGMGLKVYIVQLTANQVMHSITHEKIVSVIIKAG